MSTRIIDDFFDQVDRDPDLAAQIDELLCDDRDVALARVVRIAASAGYPLRREELEREMASYAESDELSLPELDRVVGGAGVGTTRAFSRFASAFAVKAGGRGVVGPCNRPVGAVGPCFNPKGAVTPCD